MCRWLRDGTVPGGPEERPASYHRKGYAQGIVAARDSRIVRGTKDARSSALFLRNWRRRFERAGFNFERQKGKRPLRAAGGSSAPVNAPVGRTDQLTGSQGLDTAHFHACLFAAYWPTSWAVVAMRAKWPACRTSAVFAISSSAVRVTTPRPATSARRSKVRVASSATVTS